MLSCSGSPVLQQLIHGVFIPLRKSSIYNWSFLTDNTVKHSLKRMRKEAFQVIFHFFGCFLKICALIPNFYVPAKKVIVRSV